MTLGNLIGMCIESFAIIIICIYLMDDSRKTLKRHNSNPEKNPDTGMYMFITASIWMCWRLWFTGSSIITFMKWR